MLVSTSTLGGHVDTIASAPAAGRRRRRKHSDEFKSDAVAAASQSGVSMAAVALALGINANLLRRWVREAEVVTGRALEPTAPPPAAAFVPVRVPQPASPMGEIRIDVRRGSTTVTVSWPMAAAAECTAWIRELLR